MQQKFRQKKNLPDEALRDTPRKKDVQLNAKSTYALYILEAKCVVLILKKTGLKKAYDVSLFYEFYSAFSFEVCKLSGLTNISSSKF